MRTGVVAGLFVLGAAFASACSSFSGEPTAAPTPDGGGVDGGQVVPDGAASDVTDAGVDVDSGAAACTLVDESFASGALPKTWKPNVSGGTVEVVAEGGEHHLDLTAPAGGYATVTLPALVRTTPDLHIELDLSIAAPAISLGSKTAYVQLVTLSCRGDTGVVDSVTKLTYDDRGFVLGSELRNAAGDAIVYSAPGRYSVKIDLDTANETLTVGSLAPISVAAKAPLAPTCDLVLGIYTSSATASTVSLRHVCVR